jgi:mediator of RNA polymerase II transcription subunit 13
VELIDRASSTPAQIFLQIIPMSLIASSTAMVIPDHTLMTQVAFEVYERCFVVDNSKFEPLPSSPRGPLFVLGQSPPDSIDYRISSSSATQNENSYIHVAYSSSPDDRWVSAAWIDPEGKAQYSASYCRGKSSSAISRPFSDVAKEIWETTVELIRSKPVRWQILLIKAGSITPKEMEGKHSSSNRPCLSQMAHQPSVDVIGRLQLFLDQHDVAQCRSQPSVTQPVRLLHPDIQNVVSSGNIRNACFNSSS